MFCRIGGVWIWCCGRLSAYKKSRNSKPISLPSNFHCTDCCSPILFYTACLDGVEVYLQVKPYWLMLLCKHRLKFLAFVHVSFSHFCTWTYGRSIMLPNNVKNWIGINSSQYYMHYILHSSHHNTRTRTKLKGFPFICLLPRHPKCLWSRRHSSCSLPSRPPHCN